MLAEIELFYLLPHQRRWENWFPEVMYVSLIFFFKKKFPTFFLIYKYLFLRYYYANLDRTREKVYELINEDKWNANEFSEMKKSLLEALNIKDSYNNNMQELLLEKSNNNEILLQELLKKINK